MPKEIPDHHDAELVFRVYEMRREEVLRASRDTLNQKFWPKTYQDVAAMLKPDNPMNAAWRQVTTYWEMVYGTVRHGIVHAEYFMESNGEGLFLFAKVHPFLAELRNNTSPFVFRNAEWVATHTATGERVFWVATGRIKAQQAPRV